MAPAGGRLGHTERKKPLSTRQGHDSSGTKPTRAQRRVRKEADWQDHALKTKISFRRGSALPLEVKARDNACVKREGWPQGNQGPKNRAVKPVNRIGNEIQIRGKETLNRKGTWETRGWM